ncbi:TPA: hypothetical protein JAN90_06940 [Legionella pneumophila]|uniref:SidE phosphodiesterase domain-containing protein n=1 Tax=Legionella sp. PATHC039 TaxID=2992042 RepID=UPI001A19DD57|nr:SidE phosphodiesterase domain-containing protein [Legionella sp. PATHC039]HAT7072511.1 hypothetical protein [Legionella pneumophila]HAT8859568.1 hypothetical protein [Legionella pneumophila subsp. pneumophila]MCW8395709.1 SidE phosphodiesterase domain-containing protein [Legionella sp. PATHC039]HAT9650169.1 hypothetical protein [Legionella pneumophila subsp. pneumophila]HAU0161364.1 hypothetical protein [Legionella pneumophila]
MRTLINQNRFLKAIEYVSENHFSKPYSISPMVDRWFNQLSMVHLANGKIVHLSGKDATEFVDITLDGKVVDKKDLAIVFQFHSQRSEHEKERAALVKKIEELKEELKNIVTENKEKKGQLEAEEKKLEEFDNNKIKAKKLYEDIVERGTSSLNEERLEKKYDSKITQIVHRPNHGLTHSVRVSYLVTGIHAFKQEFNKHSKALDDNTELEKSQMMMLFSVVGRRDETGFNDTGDNVKGCETYESFRTTSGREYLKYCRAHLTDLYKDNLDAMYRDAIIVELMGYSNIQDRIDRREDDPPQVFIDYIIEKEKQLGNDISREEALNLTIKPQSRKNKTPKYSLDKFFPKGPIQELADAKLDMMNDAHGIDLTRCYPLYPSKKGGAKAIGIIEDYVNLSGLSESLKSANLEKLESVFKFLRCSFDTLQLTGQRSMFGLISQETFDSQKDSILLAIQDINKRFQTPIKKETRAELIEEITKAREADNYYKNLEGSLALSNKSNPTIEAYRKHLILQEIVKHITAAPKLTTDKRMFDFQNTQEGNPHKIDHHKNAVSLVNGLQSITPVKGVTKVNLPVISAVKHNRLGNKVTVSFESQEQAQSFKEMYDTLFGAKLDITQHSPKQFSLEVNREHYKQLRDDKLVEFKQVSVPKVINREDSLVDPEGNIIALDMIQNSRALVRLVSTTALSGETFPDYDYLLRAFEDPVHERYTPTIRENIHFPVIHGKYTDPRTNRVYDRKVVTTTLPEVRFQEPVTEPVKFEDKVADGWVVGKPGAPQNTIFTKKLAHTLLPPHGKVIPFSGYPDKKWNYFPIGVLSDVRQVDLRDERYIWSENMDTVNKFWIKDHSKTNLDFCNYLNAQMEKSGQPKRYPKTNFIALDKSKLLKESSTKEELIEHLQKRKKKIFDVLKAKAYRPNDEALQDFKNLLQQERKIYLNRFTKNKVAQKEIKELYSAMIERINIEAARKSSKYAINLSQLIQLQKERVELGGHNEILAGNTKGATQAFYATRDQLFDRLNLAFHALEIKKKYQYDVPLLVLSQDKPPYHYTEAMIKEDLKTAYDLLRKGEFPYDKTKTIAYELDSKGNALRDKDGNRIRKKTSGGDDVYEEKNQVYQKDLLVNLFKLALPLTDITQLEKGQIDSETLDEVKIDVAIDSIVEQMDVLGGLARERKLMQQIFSQKNKEKQEQFFLRQIALGNLSLVQEMARNRSFVISPMLLEKAVLVAEKNNHKAVRDFLAPPKPSIEEVREDIKVAQPTQVESVGKETFIEKSDLKSEIENLKKPIDLSSLQNVLKSHHERIAAIVEINLRDQSSLKLDNILLLQKTTVELLLNPSSNNENNKNKLDEFIKLLNAHPQYKESYAHVLAASDKSVSLSSILKAHDLWGVELTAKAIALLASQEKDVFCLDDLIEIYKRMSLVMPLVNCQEHLKNAMSLVENRGMEDANNYLLLVEYGRESIAKMYFKDAKALSFQPRIDAIREKVEGLIENIEANGFGSMDKKTKNFCDIMKQMVEENKNDYLFLLGRFHDLVKVHGVITSPEMQDIKKEIARLEYNASGFFGSRTSLKQANTIKEALSKTPLLEREHILTGDSLLCRNVQRTLHSIGILVDKLDVEALLKEESTKKLSN